MKRESSLLIIWLLLPSILGAQIFGDRIDMGRIEHDAINEASGIVASSQNPGVLWTHNDSGGRNVLFAFETTGRHLGEYHIAGIQNRDWEDLSLGQDPVDGKYYLFIGEIGDNYQRYDKKYIFRVPEPVVDANQAPVDTVLYGAERLVFRYPDGNKNAETLMFDQMTGDIYVVSKEARIRLYRAPYPQNFYPVPTTHVDTLQLMLTLDLSTAVGGDISPSGLEILLKFHHKIYYWSRQPDEPLWQALGKNPAQLPYVWEPQGEAVCWDAAGRGYYTLSEEANSRPAHLYYYPRIDTTTAVFEGEHTAFGFQLKQNYPNPFNEQTVIFFTLSRSSNVQLHIFDMKGQLVRAVVENRTLPAGSYAIRWNGTDRSGRGVSSGIYLYQLKAGSFVRTRRMLFLK